MEASQSRSVYRQKVRVYAIDYNQNAIELTKRNLQRFGVKAEIFLSKAQDILPLLPQVDAVIIGGTWGDAERDNTVRHRSIKERWQNSN